MASLQVNLSTGEVGMAGGGGYFSSNVAVSGVQIADANGDLTNITANTVFASNLNVTGDFVKVTQSAGASGSQPALTINQETPGDILQLQRSGAAKVTVLENGNVGIGTSTPQQALHVTGSARVDGNALIGDSATGDAHTVLGSASVTYSGTSTALTVNQQGTGKLFEVQDAGTARMTILDGGFVGIGTAAPQQALHVIGSATLSSNLVVSGNITATGLLTASNLRVLGDYVILDTISSNTEQMVITNDGTGPALKVTQTGANSIAEFYDDGNALAFKVANDGLVGIGTATPQAKLHVVGSVKATTSISSDTQFLGQAADTASAPSFSFAADPNTGVFQPAASNLAVSTGGTERMRVLANGNVGIGTTNPVEKLHVQGTMKATGSVKIQSMTESDIVTTDGSLIVEGFGRTLGTNTGQLGLGRAIIWRDDTNPRYSSTSIDSVAAIRAEYDTAGADTLSGSHGITFYTFRGWEFDKNLTEKMRISSLGNVGIGTTNPVEKLHVQGNILSSGSTSAGTQFLGLAADAVTTPSYSWTDDSNTGMYHPGSDKLGLVTGGIERVSVLDNGNVGIGRTNPLSKLHVNGGITLEGETITSTSSVFVDSANLTNTYISFGHAGTTDDWAYLRQIGGYNANHMVLDFHDDGNDARFSIRDVSSTTNPDTITTRFTVASGGNVGIGTTNPQSMLHVEGSLYLSGALRTSSIQSTSGTTAISISSDGATSVRPKIINMGNPDVSAALVTLDDFTTTHYYSAANGNLHLRTGLVQNAVYELIWTCSGGGVNVDFVIQPNGASYTNEFVHSVRITQSDVNLFPISFPTFSTFYFDHLNGGVGSEAMGRLWFTSGPSNKYAQYMGSDTVSLVLGYGRWTNNSRTWDWVGILIASGDNKKCWIRRIG